MVLLKRAQSRALGRGSYSAIYRTHQPVIVRHRWDPAVHAQILDKRFVAVRDVADGNDRGCQVGPA